jgi:uncharacterized membrane protein
MEHIPVWIERIGLVIEIVGVLVILLGMIYAGYCAVAARRANKTGYQTFRIVFGRTLLLGLEILVAADIVKTVALEPTLENISVLGILVLIRTFLGWALVVELEGHWPWQPEPNAQGLETETLPR